MNFTRIRDWGDFSNKVYHLFVPPTQEPPHTHLDPQEGGDWTFESDTTKSNSEVFSDFKADFDLNRVTRRVNNAFLNGWQGPPPIASWYIFHLILVVGILVGVLWLLLALLYYTMLKIKGLCPTFSFKRKGKSRSGKPTDEEDPLTLHRKNRELPTPEFLEQRRQERLSVLQKECEHLEEQLIAEKNTTLTSRASDSDLEYMGYEEETPPLKRNSISLQDIPMSVMKIRREKQLRQLREEIEHLHQLSKSQDLDKIESYLPSKSPFLQDLKFEFPSSKSSSPSPVDLLGAEHLSNRIANLKAQRKLHDIRADLEGLALHLVHSDEIKAKTSSLQDIPTTALGAKRQKELLNISKEIEHMRNYKLQKKSILSTVLPETKDKKQRHEILAKLNKKDPSKNPLLNRQESEISEISSSGRSVIVSSCQLELSASIKRTRQQELNRVRVELKELSYKLNLNYVMDVDQDRDRIVPRDWPKQFSRDNSFGK